LGFPETVIFETIKDDPQASH